MADSGVDGVVLGTALVQVIAAAGSPEERERGVRDFVGSLRRGLDAR